MPQKIGNKNGFTLIEVMASMIILAIGVLGLAPMIITAIQGNSFGEDMTNANALAQDKMEELKTISYSLMASGQDTVGTVQRTWTVDRDNPITGVSQLTVITQWLDEGGNQHQVKLMTIRAE